MSKGLASGVQRERFGICVGVLGGRRLRLA
jgi:hypothetical protein